MMRFLVVDDEVPELPGLGSWLVRMVDNTLTFCQILNSHSPADVPGR